MAKILIVDDDLDLTGRLEKWLKFEHHQVETAHSGNDGLELMLANHFDAIILDWEMPGLSGPEVCKEYRNKNGSSPVIMLTGRAQLPDKERGFGAGADDYLTKPFAPKELSLRITAVLRRPAGLKSDVLQCGNLVLDPAKYLFCKDGLTMDLMPLEFSVMQLLMKHPDEVFSCDALLQRAWPANSEATDEAVRAVIKHLRKKLDRKDSPSLIKNIHGMGYKLNVDSA